MVLESKKGHKNAIVLHEELQNSKKLTYQKYCVWYTTV